LAYLAVVFLLVCVIPLAFSGNGQGTIIDHNNPTDHHSTGVGGVHLTLLILLLLIPLFAGLYVARSATIVSPEGIRVRAIFGSKFLPWESIRGLETEKRSVYAVVEQGAVRLPCVKFVDLHDVAAASGGHLPEIEAPLLKSAPHQRRPIYIRRTS
jgi:hypothetical protein